MELICCYSSLLSSPQWTKNQNLDLVSDTSSIDKPSGCQGCQKIRKTLVSWIAMIQQKMNKIWKTFRKQSFLDIFCSILTVTQFLQFWLWPYFSVMRSESFIICVRFSSLIPNQDITFAGNLITLDLFASDPFKIMLSKDGFLWKLWNCGY